MSPSVVVTERPPPATAYFVASSRTIEFQRVLSRLEPPKLSPGPPTPPLPAFVSVNQSNFAVTCVVAALSRAKNPTRAFAGRFAGRPTSVQFVPSGED